jgi:hypothetical protein
MKSADDGTDVVLEWISLVEQGNEEDDKYTFIKKSTPELILLPFDDGEIDYTLRFSVYTVPEDFDASADTMDFGNHWIRALKYKLAVDLAPVYGCNVGESYTNLLRLAEEAHSNAFVKEGEKGGNNTQVYPSCRIPYNE